MTNNNNMKEKELVFSSTNTTTTNRRKDMDKHVGEYFSSYADDYQNEFVASYHILHGGYFKNNSIE